MNRRLSFLMFVAALVMSFGSLVAQPRKTFTLVIDPGHGGRDAGACRNGGMEKNINLSVSLEVARLIKQEYPEVRVLMTRNSDRFLGLMERARFANRNKADLFISIHTNSAEGSSAQGAETFVLGLHRSADNLRVAMKENESILLEDNYQEKYQGFDPNSTESYIIFDLMQNVNLQQSISVASDVQKSLVAIGRPNRGVRQAGFLVIRETAMPAILIELGFISNRAESRYLLSSLGQKELAKAIATGFGKFYSKRFESISTPSKQTANRSEQQEYAEDRNGTSSVEKENTTAVDGTVFWIQLLTSGRKMNTTDKLFDGLPQVIREPVGKNKYYYMTGACKTLTEAKELRKSVRDKFPDAYIVQYQNGKRIKEHY